MLCEYVRLDEILDVLADEYREAADNKEDLLIRVWNKIKGLPKFRWRMVSQSDTIGTDDLLGVVDDD